MSAVTEPGTAAAQPNTSAGRLAGKRVLITGTGGGQGEAAQAMFVREGARVIGCDVQAGRAEATANSLASAGHDAWGTTVDLTDPAAAAAWVEEGAERLGGIDVLYNNAAGFGFAPFPDITYEMWKHVIDVELNLVFTVTSPAWKHLVASGAGSIINVGSISGIRGVAPLGQAAHSAAKGAIIALTKSLAAEGAEHGLRVNAISPGFVASPATDAAVDEQGRNYMLGLHLIKRAGTGDDIASLATYLASDESSWVTGQNMVIDGGWSSGFN
ncbi:SDR family oxidoreductase [Gordonia sp. zg691]|uniref:SDR family oxidoreductase n=1 Tax=Gordonia jinghuaiqii TaxID=2758710 RepID=A0A7D7RQN3_9ACTN|nr:SDR family NAD(P)-dependent oxidoreductase [Gordonia jinghuaiqii]MBD0863054.1 SDR family oxidoreductase [Gordonia jinghuaiqii]MCR5978818.1 SDR family oxidoreductase [Gordonia jinghuaiqii]QMT01833.1 SDR family oxidoreductase [Gordonia jinghuaiqii]